MAFAVLLTMALRPAFPTLPSSNTRASLDLALLELQRFAGVGRLAPTLGHEINNLAAVFTGLLFTVQSALDEGRPPFAEEVAEFEDTVARLAAVGRSLHALGGTAAAAVQPLALHAEVARALELLGAMGCTRIVTPELVAGGEDLWVDANRSRLVQLVVDVALHSMRAVSAGQTPQTLRLSVTREGDSAVLQLARSRTPAHPREEDTADTLEGVAALDALATACGGELELARGETGESTLQLRLPLSQRALVPATTAACPAAVKTTQVKRALSAHPGQNTRTEAA